MEALVRAHVASLCWNVNKIDKGFLAYKYPMHSEKEASKQTFECYKNDVENHTFSGIRQFLGSYLEVLQISVEYFCAKRSLRSSVSQKQMFRPFVRSFESSEVRILVIFTKRI